MKRKRGGQKGNHNARTHGFYSGDLTPGQISEFWHIITTEKIAPQSAIMRIKLRSLLQQGPVNRRVLKDAARLLARWQCGPSTTASDFRKVADSLYVVLENMARGREEDLTI